MSSALLGGRLDHLRSTLDDRGHGARARRRFAILVLIGTLLSIAFVARPVLVIMALAGLGFVAVVVTSPRAVLVAAPPLLLLGTEYSPTAYAQLALPGLLIVVTVVGMMSGRFKTSLLPQGLLAVLGLWLIVSYRFALKVGPIAPQTQSSLLNCLLVLGIAIVTVALVPRREQVLKSVVAMGVITALFLRVQAIGSLHPNGLADVRVVALGYDPNGLGILMALGSLAALGLTYAERRPVWLLTVLLMATSLPLTKSRASILVAAVGLAVLVLFHRSRRVQFGVALALVAVLLVFPNAKQQVVDSVLKDRAEHLDPHSDWVRKQLVIEGFKAGARNPVMGLGFGRFPVVMQETPSIALSRDPHNQYSEFMGSAGVPALALFIGFIWLAVRARIRDRTDLALKGLMGGVLIAMTTAPELYNLAGGSSMLMVVAAIAAVDAERRVDAADEDAHIAGTSIEQGRHADQSPLRKELWA